MVGELLRSAIAKEVVVPQRLGCVGSEAHERRGRPSARARDPPLAREPDRTALRRPVPAGQSRAARRVRALGRDFRQDVVSRITSDLSGHDHAEILLGLEELHVRRQVLVKSESRSIASSTTDCASCPTWRSATRSGGAFTCTPRRLWRPWAQARARPWTRRAPGSTGRASASTIAPQLASAAPPDAARVAFAARTGGGHVRGCAA